MNSCTQKICGMVSSEHSSNKDKIKQQQKKTKEKNWFFFTWSGSLFESASVCKKKNNFQKQTWKTGI